MPIIQPPGLEYFPEGPFPETIVRWREELSSHPAFEWVEGIYRRHRGSSAEVAA